MSKASEEELPCCDPFKRKKEPQVPVATHAPLPYHITTWWVWHFCSQEENVSGLVNSALLGECVGGTSEAWLLAIYWEEKIVKKKRERTIYITDLCIRLWKYSGKRKYSNLHLTDAYMKYRNFSINRPSMSLYLCFCEYTGRVTESLCLQAFRNVILPIKLR